MLGFLSILSTPLVASVSTAGTKFFATVIGLGLLIFIHELGHFMTAKLLGIGVLKFSLGFGRRLIGFKRGETEYMISVFPLGGYVKMLGEEEESDETDANGVQLPDAEKPAPLSEEDRKRTFSAQPAWKRAAIVFAGPLSNIILAFVLVYLIFVTGAPTPIALISEVAPGSPAAAAGFVKGDIVRYIDDEEMDVWSNVNEYIKKNPGKLMNFRIVRGDTEMSVQATPDKDGFGLYGNVLIGQVPAGDPADKAGLKPSDRVVSIDGNKLASWDDMQAIIAASLGKKLDFVVERGGKMITAQITPIMKDIPDENKAIKKKPVIGIMGDADYRKMPHGLIESIPLSIDKTLYMTTFTVTFIGHIMSGKESASQMGGPIAIYQISGEMVKRGFTDFVFFLALLSVNLGVINLFPVPILDGGHIMFLTIESIMGKPLSMKQREMAQQVGMFLLMSLMVLVFYNDISRILASSSLFK